MISYISRWNAEYNANQSLNRKCEGIQWSLPVFPKVLDHSILWAEFLGKENLPHSFEVNDFMYLQILMWLEQIGLVFSCYSDCSVIKILEVLLSSIINNTIKYENITSISDKFSKMWLKEK